MSYNITQYIRPEFYPHRFTSGDDAVDLLLRWDNWNNGTGRPVTLTYNFVEPTVNTHSVKFVTILDMFDEVVFDKTPEGWQNHVQYSVSESWIPQNKQGYYQTSEEWELGFFKQEWNNLQPKNQEFCIQSFDEVPALRAKFKKIISERFQENYDEDADTLYGFLSGEQINLFANCTYQDLEDHRYELEELFSIEADAVVDEDKLKVLVESSVKLWSRYANINFVQEEENPQIKINFSGGPVDVPVWNNGLMLNTRLSLQTRTDYKTFSESANSISEMHHGIGHAFLDHPNDNVMFDDRIYEFNEELVPDHPLSKCGTVMHHFSCSNFDAISPMPTDIKALHHLYTPRCNDEATRFTMNGQGEVTPLYDYIIPERSLFTIWDCKPAILDLSKAEGQNVKLDLHEGVGHISEVGRDHFQLAYGVKVGQVILPENTSQCSVIMNPEFDTEIIGNCFVVEA